VRALCLRYNNWEGDHSESAARGTYRLNINAGASAKFDFVGMGVDWVTEKGPGYGKANVFIDGLPSGGTVDLYAPTQEWQAASSFNGLSVAPHTIEIKPLGTRNPSSKGMEVIVDAFRVALPPRGMPTRANPNTESASPWWILLLPFTLPGFIGCGLII